MTSRRFDDACKVSLIIINKLKICDGPTFQHCATVQRSFPLASPQDHVHSMRQQT
jgi:hypothetical protein